MLKWFPNARGLCIESSPVRVPYVAWNLQINGIDPSRFDSTSSKNVEVEEEPNFSGATVAPKIVDGPLMAISTRMLAMNDFLKACTRLYKASSILNRSNVQQQKSRFVAKV